jgi:hypothetical protein
MRRHRLPFAAAMVANNSQQPMRRRRQFWRVWWALWTAVGWCREIEHRYSAQQTCRRSMTKGR